MPVSRDDAAGWMLRCRPTVWDLDAVRARPGPVPFALARTYRRHLLHVGDPVFLWVGGGGAGSGLAATGSVVAPATDRVEPSLWRDSERAADEQPYADVALDFLPAPIAPNDVRAVAALAGLELLCTPRAGNPTIVRNGELGALQDLVAAAY